MCYDPSSPTPFPPSSSESVRRHSSTLRPSRPRLRRPRRPRQDVSELRRRSRRPPRRRPRRRHPPHWHARRGPKLRLPGRRRPGRAAPSIRHPRPGPGRARPLQQRRQVRPGAGPAAGPRAGPRREAAGRPSEPPLRPLERARDARRDPSRRRRPPGLPDRRHRPGPLPDPPGPRRGGPRAPAAAWAAGCALPLRAPREHRGPLRPPGRGKVHPRRHRWRLRRGQARALRGRGPPRRRRRRCCPAPLLPRAPQLLLQLLPFRERNGAHRWSVRFSLLTGSLRCNQ